MSMFNVIVRKEEGRYCAEVPDLPGCFTEADTLDDLKKNIVEAAQCWITMEKNIALDNAKADSLTGNLQFA